MFMHSYICIRSGWFEENTFQHHMYGHVFNTILWTRFQHHKYGHVFNIICMDTFSHKLCKYTHNNYDYGITTN